MTGQAGSRLIAAPRSTRWPKKTHAKDEIIVAHPRCWPTGCRLGFISAMTRLPGLRRRHAQPLDGRLTQDLPERAGRDGTVDSEGKSSLVTDWASAKSVITDQCGCHHRGYVFHKGGQDCEGGRTPVP